MTSKVFATAADALRAASATDEASSELKAIAVQALAASGRTSEAANLVPGGVSASVGDRVSSMLVALYKPAPIGFQEVLSIADQIGSMPEAQGSAEFRLYRAAACGQQHHALLGDPPSDERIKALADARNCALESIRRCLGLNAAFGIRFYWLMHPAVSPAPTDNDLIDFADDAEFKASVPDPSTVIGS